MNESLDASEGWLHIILEGKKNLSLKMFFFCFFCFFLIYDINKYNCMLKDF